jgi:Lon protease-like protein
MSRRLPVFPLGTVLLPGVALPLHIFEPRYRSLMADLLLPAPGAPGGPPELGVVGIERGREVGGGELRYKVGTVSRLVQANQLPDGRWAVVLAGVSRFQVDEWLPDDPYPLAMVTDLPEPAWEAAHDGELSRLEERTRELLAMAVELGDLAGPADPQWSTEPRQAAWQVCALAPVGTLDRQRLLEIGEVGPRLELLAEQLAGVAEMFAFRLGGR